VTTGEWIRNALLLAIVLALWAIAVGVYRIWLTLSGG
jgi:uncharacterized membrane protein HdeD (DUF308 family)